MTLQQRLAALDIAEVFPLTEYIADEMIARGWTTADVVRRMGIDKDFMLSLMAFDLMMAVYATHEVLITDDVFAGLARAFDVSEQYFRTLDAAWKAHPDRRSQPLYEPPDAIWPDPPLYRINDITPEGDHG